MTPPSRLAPRWDSVERDQEQHRTADTQTQASWLVEDLRAEVAELRARGVKVEDYDMPGLQTDEGVADIGFAWAAWIIDPGNNALGILQMKI